jgi:hypothetical protein
MRFDQEGNENYTLAESIVKWEKEAEKEIMKEWTLILFRGTESLHRVTTIEQWQRVLVTFCYNKKAGISLSETSRKTFFGRIK